MSGYVLGVLVFLSFNVIAAYSVWLPLSCGQLNLGIAAFMAIGAYTAAWLTNEYHLSMWFAFPLGALLSGFLAFVMAIPVLRTSGIYLAMATLALSQVIVGVFLNVEAVGGAAGYPVTEYVPAEVVIVIGIVVTLLMIYLSKTRFFLYMSAIKKDAVVTDLMGVNIRAIKVWSFVFGAMIAGFGGALYGHHYSFVEAQHFNVMLSIYTVLYVLLGGVSSVWGPLIGAIFFTFLPELLRSSDQWRYAIFAIFIIVLMMACPQGIAGAKILRWKRKKRGRND